MEMEGVVKVEEGQEAGTSALTPRSRKGSRRRRDSGWEYLAAPPPLKLSPQRVRTKGSMGKGTRKGKRQMKMKKERREMKARKGRRTTTRRWGPLRAWPPRAGVGT